MSEFLFHYYPVHPTTWVYLSSLLMIGLFFKFGRFWSVRNLDLFLLIMLAPGLLLVHFGDAKRQSLAEVPASQGGLPSRGEQPVEPGSAMMRASEPAVVEMAGDPATAAVDISISEDAGATTTPAPADVDSTTIDPGVDNVVLDVSEPLPEGADPIVAGSAAAPPQGLSGRTIQYLGFVWLLTACGLLLVRLLLDPTMVRRPLLEPNLSPGGLTFIGCSLFVFLMANVVSSQVTEEDLAGPRGAEQLLAGVTEEDAATQVPHQGPGNALLHFVPRLATVPLKWTNAGPAEGEFRYVRTAKAMAVLSHLAVVFGIVAIGYRHFENIRMGIGAATLYLMLPYTSQMTGRVDHVLPAALLVWAVLCYRRPMTAGMFIGLAIGVLYYPLFLLPLWISFYWQRGVMRFVTGVLTTLMISVLSLTLVSADFPDFVTKVQGLFGIWLPLTGGLRGIWGLGWDPVYRIPVLAGFVVISFAFALWPPQKNLGTLLSCSAAVMVATQFWHGFGGGLYMAWFLPLVLLTIFRPNLEDRVALSVLGESWFHRRRHRAKLNGVERAA